MAGRPLTRVPRWTGQPWVRTSRHGGRERQVTVYRAQPGHTPGPLTRFAGLALAAAVWAAATYAAAVVVNRRLELGFTESVQDSEFQLVLLAVGTGVWVVVGLPLLFGWWVFKAVRDRTSAGAVTGTVVFRGEVDPRRGVDDNRRPEYYVAVDDGSTDRVPAYLAPERTVARLAEGDVVKASVTRAGVPRVLHLVVLQEAGSRPP